MPKAAEVFRAYVAQDSESVRADRVQLQLGLALEQLERQEEALAVFAELAETYDPSTMSFEEQTQAALAGLREGQSRRSLAVTSRVIIAAKPVMVPTVAVPVCESCCDNEDDVQPNLRHSFIALHRSARS